MEALSESSAIKKYALYLALLAVGIGLGFYLDKDTKPPIPVSVREDTSGYKFINPLLFVLNEQAQEPSEYTALHESIQSYIDKATTEKKISDASVYFRQVNKGKWISVYPEKTYSPSSMLKVVTLITVLRAAESDPSLLSKTITISGDDSQLQNSVYAPKEPIRSGSTHTVSELIEHSIIESDNVANQTLRALVGEERLSKTYADLHMPMVDAAEDRGYTTENYSHLFRALYNGTYLSRPTSENVLSLLTRTSFDKGIVAGVPEGTTVSHKFGVNVFAQDKTSSPYSELHDCGLVYYPDHPYHICIMTRGKDFSDLETVLKDISKIGWDYVDSANKEEN